LRRAIAKPHPRLVAVDDGAFRRTDRRAPLAAVVVAAPDYVEAVRVGSVTVDGRDATRRIVALVRATGPLEGVRAVLLDGAVVGGFNVVDLDAVHTALALPVVALTRRPPAFPKIRAALDRWFPRDAEERWRRLTAHPLRPVDPGAGRLLAAAVGIPARDVAVLLRRTRVRGLWPEPLRLAHLVASAAVPGPPRRI